MSFIREDPIDEFELDGVQPQELYKDAEKALLKPIIAHILAEANDKADEIDLKGLEEFRAEKRRFFKEQKAKIDHFYERKHKQVDTANRVYHSNKVNESRIQMLLARDKLLKEVFNEAREDLRKISGDKNRYPHILKGLIMQGLLQLMEPKVVLRCRKEDEKIVSGILKTVAEEQEKACGIKPKIVLDPTPLPDNIAGGVELYARDSRIMVSSTLESRLGLIADQIVPQIRTALFGPNPNRAFFD
uniref:Vacuolar ATP synthase subunit E n=1 Tax=Panagrolaimus sp. JU765 TaxID=591449 RepID=A0AC34R833_9BILA